MEYEIGTYRDALSYREEMISSIQQQLTNVLHQATV